MLSYQHGKKSPGHMPVYCVSYVPFYSSHKAHVPPNASSPTLCFISNVQPHPLTLTLCLPPPSLPWSSTLTVNATVMMLRSSECWNYGLVIFTCCTYINEHHRPWWCRGSVSTSLPNKALRESHIWSSGKHCAGVTWCNVEVSSRELRRWEWWK